MISNQNDLEIAQRRLAWRCRRGMLELDIVLQKFIQVHFSQLNSAELQAFDELLDLPDNEFWHALQFKCQPLDSMAQQAVFNKLLALQVNT